MSIISTHVVMGKLRKNILRRVLPLKVHDYNLDVVGFFDKDKDGVVDVLDTPLLEPLQKSKYVYKCLTKLSCIRVPSINYKLDIDLRDKCPGIYDQMNTGSCTAHAAALLYKSIRANFEPSRMFLYYASREMEGRADRDEGVVVHTALNAMKEVGMTTENMWPFNTDKLTVRPPDHVYAAASANRITFINRINRDVESMIGCLQRGKPFMFGFNLDEGFRKRVGRSGIFNRVNGDLQNSHAVVCVGYSREQRAFLVANSWGRDWGLKGYFLFHEDLITRDDLVGMIWTIV